MLLHELAFVALSQAKLPEISLRPGLVITQSCRIKPGTYWIKSAGESAAQAAVRIEGKDIVVDMADVILEGTPPTVDPDARKGLGIAIQGDGITLRNGRVRGYKVAVMATQSSRLKVTNLDASYNWKQRLYSTPAKEDLVDWMSFHKNENNEWLRFGAAIYLNGVEQFDISNSRAVGGQCGLMMTKSNKGRVVNNNFSYLSAVGLGMYRSSDNVIMHNKLDYCVRGYSHGVYNRGQDSTGILIYEQSHRNIFAYNSATHGGDGFFLWAGQSTMDTGQGGCNDNILYANDFSHSPANAIEATFSRNAFVYNLLVECWHGVWGGYSYDTAILLNQFGANGEAIAIEHGQKNVIAGNAFYRDTMGIYLWQNNRAPDPNWGYPKFRDTRNKGTSAFENRLQDIPGPAFLVDSGTNISISNNRVIRAKPSALWQGTISDSTFTNNEIFHLQDLQVVPGLKAEGNVWNRAEADVPAPIMSRGGNAFPKEDAAIKEVLERALSDWRPYRGVNQFMVRDKLESYSKKFNQDYTPFYIAPLEGGKDVFLKATDRRGRNTIFVDAWGPYDFQSPRLVLRSRSVQSGGSERLVFDMLGPAGAATVKRTEGLRVLAGQSLKIPGKLIVEIDKKSARREIALEYVGERTVDYRGIATAKGKPVRFDWSEFFIPIDWTVNFFTYDPKTQEPRSQRDAFTKILSGTPLRTETPATLDYAWAGAAYPQGPANHFATVSTGNLNVAEGEYEIVITSDDGVALWLDGRKVLENWTWHGPTVDRVTVKLKGSHRLRLEHFEIDGYATLKVEVVPKRSSQPLR